MEQSHRGGGPGCDRGPEGSAESLKQAMEHMGKGTDAGIQVNQHSVNYFPWKVLLGKMIVNI